MEIHLLTARGNFGTTGGQFCDLPCDQNSGHMEGIKRKAWTLSFHWHPLVFCGFSGLDTTASKFKHFFKKLKMLKIDQLCLAEKLYSLDSFFKWWLPFLEESRYWHETKARWLSKHHIFIGRKKLVKMSNHLKIVQFENWPPPVRTKTKKHFHVSLGFHGRILHSFLGWCKIRANATLTLSPPWEERATLCNTTQHFFICNFPNHSSFQNNYKKGITKMKPSIASMYSFLSNRSPKESMISKYRPYNWRVISQKTWKKLFKSRPVFKFKLLDESGYHRAALAILRFSWFGFMRISFTDF